MYICSWCEAMVDNEIFDGFAMPKKCQCNSIHFSNWFDGKYIEENALKICKLFISSLIWIRQGVSVAWPWCSRFYCLALAVSSARWEFLKLSASLIQTTLGYHKLANVCMPFLLEKYAKVYWAATGENFGPYFLFWILM